MKPVSLVALCLLGFASGSFASSFVATTDTIGASLANTVEGTTNVTSSVGDDKVVLEARPDAASFVASEGDIRGVRLEAALKHIRTELPQVQASDMQLAEAILAL
ncbi:conserverd hypothetical protein [Halopseudomonas xinjiangensis]|uniref:Holliday junction resolvasome, helicase subunit n=1 Tax=Halopseudomonas xinjiangensis TaxID=487184 RepID=A0A1H1LIG9_9GAMM|nr:DUF2388 domain-containing protein [Halopseudomonas xinjiangensis]SDR74364.1 conserverd hypothetical protein [Halopseudomonas xinjiangensis]